MEKQIETRTETLQELELKEEQEESRLPAGKKILLFFTGLLAFFIFFVIFFPYANFIRYLIASYVKEIKIDYSDLQLSLFSPVVIRDLFLSNQKNISFSGEEIHIKPHIPDLLFKKIHARWSLSGGTLRIDTSDIIIKNFTGYIALVQPYNIPPNQWNGNAEFKIKQIQVSELSGQLKYLPLTEEQKILKNIQISLTIQQGKYTIPGTTIDNPLFKITLQFQGNLANTLTQTTMNGKICLTPDPELEETNPAVYGLYITAGGSMEKELCVSVKGTLFEPKFDILNQ